MIEKCKEEFGKHSKAMEEMQEWMQQIRSCALGGVSEVPSTRAGPGGFTRVVKESPSTQIERINQIMLAYGEWEKHYQQMSLSNSEKEKYSEMFRE